MSANIFLQIFIVFFLLKYTVQFYLSIRNVLYIRKHSGEVPAVFAQKITLAEHQKAASYAQTKAFVSWPFLLLDIIILSYWIFWGGLEKLDLFVRSFGISSSLGTGLAFFGIYSLIGMILDMPESLINTFIVEERFGFNHTTIKIFISDLIKQLFLGLILGIPILAGLLSIMDSLGTYWWIYAIVFFISFQLLLLFIYPSWIAPLFNSFTPLEDGDMKDKIVQLLKKIQFEFKGLFVMDASKRSGHGNAYFTGFGKNKRIVFFDTLIKTLNPEEVQAVLAHELGHFKKKHILKSMILSFVMVGVGIYLISICLKSDWFYQAFQISDPSSYMALILFSSVMPFFTFFISPIMAYFSRKNEFEADTYACENANGFDLISALIKMYRDNASSLTPDPLFVKFYHSHPPALERIDFIKNQAPSL